MNSEAMINEAGQRIADATGALGARCVMLAGQLAAAREEIERLKAELVKLQDPRTSSKQIAKKIISELENTKQR